MNKEKLSSSNMESGHKTESTPANGSKQVWVKPELQKIDAGTDTEAAKPNNFAFESSPGWGIS